MTIISGGTNPAFPTSVRYSDSGGLDSFGRVRTSNPVTIFDAQNTYGIHTILFESTATGSGAAIAHDSTNRMVGFTFASTPTGGVATMQTYEHFRYQPGKSQEIMITFNMIEGKADTIKFAGYSDGTNGVEFAMVGTTPTFRLLSSTSNGNQSVSQNSWNLDKLDGTDDSGITLDITKTQILVIDLQALYVGRVRVGFVMDGVTVYAHQFLHANRVATPYIATANLPIRIGMTCTATVSTTMKFICCSVSSEGGMDDTIGYQFSAHSSVTAGSGVDTHALSIRPSGTFNSFVNRVKMVLESVEISVFGNYPVHWDLCIGQAISGTTTFIDVNSTYSAFQYNSAGTISGAPTIVLHSSTVPASNQSKSQDHTNIPLKYPITLDAAGNVRSLGTLSVNVQGIGGASACHCCLNWKEIR